MMIAPPDRSARITNAYHPLILTQKGYDVRARMNAFLGSSVHY
jgi:hypothetical protein